MLAIILGLGAALLGIEPSLNQPRPLSAKPMVNLVVPVAYWDEEDATFIPPAPLPEFAVEECPGIRFEFSQIESCSDSDEHPPAPPAELECVVRQGLDFDFGVSDGLACDAESEEDSCDTFCAGTCGGPKTVEELHHLRTAIEHLNDAGMPELTEHLRDQYETATAKLREQIQQKLEEKELEMRHLQEEIQLLKRELDSSEEANDDQDQTGTSGPSPTVIGLNAEAFDLVIETPRPPEPTTRETDGDLSDVINPAFYMGRVPAHIQQRWDQAMNGQPATRITSTETPEWKMAPDAPTEGAFRILRFVPDDSFPKLMVEPPAHLDDSGIFLQSRPRMPVIAEEELTPLPTIRLHLRQAIPAKPAPKSGATIIPDKQQLTPAPEKKAANSSDPET